VLCDVDLRTRPVGGRRAFLEKEFFKQNSKKLILGRASFLHKWGALLSTGSVHSQIGFPSTTSAGF